MPLPPIECARLSPFDATHLGAVRRAFDGADAVSLGQAWRDTTEERFAPTTVRVGWREATLCVFAELTDVDIVTSATRDNHRFWELGDTFEMFFQPGGREPYVEFHVAPNNRQLQLRFPDAGWLERAAPEHAFSQALLAPGRFASRVWVDTAAGQWCVLAEIPASAVCDTAVPLEGTEWRVSFSRYDHTRGCDAPVISSSSPHALPRFHRLHEWRPMRFRA